MEIIITFSSTFILFLALCVCGVTGRAFHAIASWLMNYWWVIGIIFAVCAIVQLITCRYKWRYLFFLLDIPRLGALTFLIYQFAANCMAFDDKGLAIFLFILEFIVGGALMLLIAGYGNMQCASALLSDEYTENQRLIKYIFGTIACVLGTFVFWVLSR